MVGGRIAALAEAGLLVPAAGAGAETRRPSRAGQAHIRRLLLMRSGPPVETLAALCACLKICFLELLDGAAQRSVTPSRRSPAALPLCPWSSAISPATSNAGAPSSAGSKACAA